MEIDAQCERLSPMQRACLRLLWDRKKGGQIATALKISKGTVNSHLAQARRVLGVSTSVEAAERLHVYEAANAPCNISTYPARLAADPDLSPPASLPSEPLTWRINLPFRLSGAPNNDLSVRQRLVWITFLPIVISIAFGMLAVGIHSISDIVRAARQ